LIVTYSPFSVSPLSFTNSFPFGSKRGFKRSSILTGQRFAFSKTTQSLRLIAYKLKEKKVSFPNREIFLVSSPQTKSIIVLSRFEVIYQ
jgi:hypothetical protein